MKSRQDIENIAQRITCALLPKVPREDIRITYQQNDNASKVDISDDGEHFVSGFSFSDNFVYITVVLGTNSSSYVYDNGTVQTIGKRTITFSFYGDQSAELALCLNSLLRIPQALNMFESQGLYLVSIDEDLAELRELVNEEWFDRHDFSAVFNEIVTVKVPDAIQKQNVIAEHADVTVIPDFVEVDNVVE